MRIHFKASGSLNCTTMVYPNKRVKTSAKILKNVSIFIELHDLIFIKKIKSKKHKIIFYGKFSKKINKKNTVTNLFKVLAEKKFLMNKKFYVKIKKNIPQKSGLGGGSMNAASILSFLIKKKIIHLQKEYNLNNLTKLIGSDVILGMKPENSVLLSKGEIKRFPSSGKFHILLAKPNFGCSTKYIYSKVKLYNKPKFNPANKKMFKSNYLINLRNDLEKIAFFKYPRLKKIKLFLEKMPNTIFVRMSGSGSTIVAYYNSKKACHFAKNKFKIKFKSDWCITSKTI